MYSFRSDYEEFCNDEILIEMSRINHLQKVGYGEDDYSNEVRNLIKSLLKDNNVDVHFMVGGTPTNKISIAHFLRPYEAVIAANSGHINVHETGAIENTGHKILIAESIDGKLTKESIQKVLDMHSDHHMVMPRMIFISNSTEYGTIYKKSELEELFNFAKDNDLYLYLDGARLAQALNAVDNDLTLEDIKNNTDAFYIGATKNGGLLGEALIIKNDKLKENFKYTLKELGGLLAKQSLIACQFKILFEQDLFNKNALHANKMCSLLKEAFINKGYNIKYPNNTNQLFVEVDLDTYNRLKDKAYFQIAEKYDNKFLIRFVTCFNTNLDEVNKFIDLI